ncbi:MAG: tetratricopeptide repeat protein [Myxococcales bacterium]
MINQRLLGLAAVALAFACAGIKQGRPTGIRDLPSEDVKQCYRASVSVGVPNLQGSFEIDQYVDDKGDAAAAWIHSDNGVNSATMFRCLTDLAVASKVPTQGVDYVLPSTITCVGVGVSEGKERTSGCTRSAGAAEKRPPRDDKLARDTLKFADWATPTDRGWAHYYLGDYAQALPQFEAATKADPKDERALRGLAQTLADSKGDLNRAKEAAQKSIELKPESEATHEAMIHVCLAMKDDKCAFDEFNLAKVKPDLDLRRREIGSVQDRVKEAADRLQSGVEAEEQKERTAQTEAAAAAAKADPTGCRKLESGSDAQLLCLIKRCFEKGAREYAKELKPLTGQDYAAGDWKVTGHTGTKAKVTVPIRVAAAQKTGKGKKAAAEDEGPQAHDATWDVSVGENITMQAANFDAANIAKSHDSCKK